MMKLQKDEVVYKGCYALTMARGARPGKLVQRTRVATQHVTIKVAWQSITVPVKVKQQYVDTVGGRAGRGGGVKVGGARHATPQEGHACEPLAAHR